jgi:hypothetical protein
MSRQSTVSVADFVKVYLPAVRRGESRVTIGKALGFVGTDAEIELKVSAKATQCRKVLKDLAVAKATAERLSEESTTTMVAAYLAKLPRVKQARDNDRKGLELIAAIDNVLAEIDNVE